MLMTTLAQRIQQRMDTLGITQDRLAFLSGLSQSAIHKLISGKSMSSRRMPQLAKALKCDIYWLTDGKGSMEFTPSPDSNTHKTKAKPPIISDEEWKTLPLKARTLVEDFLTKTSGGKLSESSIKLLQETVDELSKEK